MPIVYPTVPGVPVDCGPNGSTVYNDGPETVYYRDESPVSASVNDGSIASGASATLYGTQFVTVVSGSASVRVAARPADSPESGLGDLEDVTLGTPANGQALIYDSATGEWISGDPVGPGVEGDYHENVTGVITTASVNNQEVDIPGCTLTVPPTAGIVRVKARFYAQQTVVGTGRVYAFITETTAGAGVSRRSEDLALPNSIASQLQNIGWLRPEWRLGAVAAERTFKLQASFVQAAGTPQFRVLNSWVIPTPSAIWYEVS